MRKILIFCFFYYICNTLISTPLQVQTSNGLNMTAEQGKLMLMSSQVNLIFVELPLLFIVLLSIKIILNSVSKIRG